jgi:hypothetical protein
MRSTAVELKLSLFLEPAKRLAEIRAMEVINAP